MRVNGTVDAERVIANQRLDAVKLLIIELAGTVHHGKSRHKQDASVDDPTQGIVLKSANGHWWRLQVNDLGQVITTDLGV